MAPYSAVAIAAAPETVDVPAKGSSPSWSNRADELSSVPARNRFRTRRSMSEDFSPSEEFPSGADLVASEYLGGGLSIQIRAAERRM